MRKYRTYSNDILVCKICCKKCKKLRLLSSHIYQEHSLRVKYYFEVYFPRFCMKCGSKIPYITNTPIYLRKNYCCSSCKNKNNTKGFVNGPWNKNLNKDIDERVKKYGEKNKKHHGNRNWHDDQKINNSKEYFDNRRKAAIEGNRALAKNGKTGSYPELVIRKYLNILGIKYDIQVPIEAEAIHSLVDIVIGNKILLYIDGERFHTNPYSGKDKKINIIYPNYGYKILRFWSKEVMGNTIGCVRKILELIKTISREVIIDPLETERQLSILETKTQSELHRDVKNHIEKYDRQNLPF